MLLEARVPKTQRCFSGSLVSRQRGSHGLLQFQGPREGAKTIFAIKDSCFRLKPPGQERRDITESCDVTRRQVLTSGGWEGQGERWGGGQRDPARLPRRPQRAPVHMWNSLLPRRKGEERRAGRVGGPRRCLSRPPPSQVPSPGTQPQPGGQPQPLPRPSRGRRRQSPSGQSRDPDLPSQVSVRGEGKAEKTGPGPRSRRIGAGGPGQGLGRSRARTRRSCSCCTEGVVTGNLLHDSGRPVQPRPRTPRLSSPPSSGTGSWRRTQGAIGALSAGDWEADPKGFGECGWGEGPPPGRLGLGESERCRAPGSLQAEGRGPPGDSLPHRLQVGPRASVSPGSSSSSVTPAGGVALFWKEWERDCVAPAPHLSPGAQEWGGGANPAWSPAQQIVGTSPPPPAPVDSPGDFHTLPRHCPSQRLQAPRAEPTVPPRGATAALYWPCGRSWDHPPTPAPKSSGNTESKPLGEGMKRGVPHPHARCRDSSRVAVAREEARPRRERA